jgi:benzil reductase ((S)-benzoin forming)
MRGTLIWISGASGGIGQALVRTVPWAGARVIGVGRHAAPGADHLAVDLADPQRWELVAASFAAELKGFDGERVVFVHAAGTLEPMGFAGEVDPAAYCTNVILNSAAPQALGHLFLGAVREVDARRSLVMLTSGAARSVYPGWASYGAAKAAVDQWVRDVGAEQELRGGVRLLAVAPGTVDTGMQARMRATPERDFPSRQKFFDLFEAGKLTSPDAAAKGIWAAVDDETLPNGSVVDLRDRPLPG